MHRSGFVNIVGRPNVGKSTLMNALVGERMSVITAKPQTTRHRIIGIVSGEDFQIVFSDTPGIIRQPAYKMQEKMNQFVQTAFEDADLMLLVVGMDEKYDEEDPVIAQLKTVEAPLFLVLNKTDLAEPEQVLEQIKWWNERLSFAESVPISALQKQNTDKLLELIQENLPEGPEYFPKDQLTDRTERFFVSEIVRGKILELYHQEIPYSSEVTVEWFKEKQTTKGAALIEILAIIYVTKESQKKILLGKGGSAIKKLGTESRLALETWLESKVYLELQVKVRDKWRDDEKMLRHFGYDSGS